MAANSYSKASTTRGRRRTLWPMFEALAKRMGREPDGGALSYAAAFVLVSVSTLVGMLMAPRWGNSAVDLVYLPAVLALAVLAGLGPALLAAVAAALAYNYFFTAPYHTFRIHSPSDIVTVIVLFLVATVTSQLAASIRKQAQLAQSHAARNATIAGLARQLLSCTTEAEIAEVALKELGGVFDCNAVSLTGEPELRVIASYPETIRLTPSDLGVAATVRATGEAAGRGITRVTTVEWQMYPVISGKGVLGIVALARNDGMPAASAAQRPLLDSLLDQVALALERVRLETEAREFATLRERDATRSALLASIGEDIRPRLKTILNGVGELRRGGTADRTLVSSIGAEALKVDRYISDLVELGPGSDQEPVEADGLKIDLFHRAVSRDGRDIHLTPKEYSVLAELAKHPGRVLSHTHLLRAAWGPAQERQTEYLRVAGRGLRQKLERDPTRPKIITNEPGVGYRLTV